ncbi:L10-interacting MYB domain-containing protein-like [Humulus lupulus]|uniref:L10-interacting MYB domain-containing protein-like n=1 Tax=Humulus lupulus TaxID=3486 RepID=UPI002B405EAD|nr:L10-interacting MYB domain-containing protein-like [Humulus lupulus]
MAGVDNEVLIIENNDEASVWTQKHEEIFIELMEEEVLKGNKNTTTFTKQSWKYIKEELCARAKRNYSDMQLRNKYNQLKQKHKDFKSLLKETGMGYNAVTGEVSATDEVWDKLIRVNKSAKRFRKKGCKFYEKLCTIFGDTTATDSNAHPSTRSPSNDGDNNDDDATSISPSTRNEESGFDEDGSKRIGKSTATSNSRSVKRAKFSSALADALATYNETAKRKTELIERSMATSASHYLLDESVEALNQIDGISGEVYAKAIEKFENEVSIALFLKMPKHRRIDWLLNLK